jgi:hypothetical protein
MLISVHRAGMKFIWSHVRTDLKFFLVFLGKWLPATDFLAVITDDLQRIIGAKVRTKCFAAFGSRHCCWLPSLQALWRCEEP